MNTRTDAHPVELLLLGAWLALEAAAVLVVALVALLQAVARPTAAAIPTTGEATSPELGSPAVEQACAAEPLAIPAPPLEQLTVAQLRRLARQAGLPRSLSRSGRRAELLEALG